MEKIVKRYVDCILAFDGVFDEIGEQIKEEDVIPFFRAVAEEMRNRGINEEKINNALKGAALGQRKWKELQAEIKESPSILDEG